MEVNKRLVRVGPNGVEEIYAGAPTSDASTPEGRAALAKQWGLNEQETKEFVLNNKYEPTSQNSTLGPYKDMKEKAGVEEGMRKEVSALSKDYFTVRDSEAKINAVASDPSAASDLALIFSFMKVLDPGSVVREQEFANAQNAAGVPDQVRNLYNLS